MPIKKTIIERFNEQRLQRIEARYQKYMAENIFVPSNRLALTCNENKSYFDTGRTELSHVSIPIIVRYDIGDGGEPVFDLVLLKDINQSNQGHIVRGYSVLYGHDLYYNATQFLELRQGVNGRPIASIDEIIESYRPCIATHYDMLRNEIHALLYLSLQDSVIQESEIVVVKSFLARKPLSEAMREKFLDYFRTSFITPSAMDDVLVLLATLPEQEKIHLLDTGINIIEANGVVNKWERQAFQELVKSLSTHAPNA